MNVRLLGAVLVVTVLTAASAKAGVYDDCEAAIADGDTVAIEGFADEIRGRIVISKFQIPQAEACVSAADGTPMIRVDGTWQDGSERAEQEAIAAAELAEQEAIAAAELAEQEAIAAAEREAVRARVCELRDLVRQNNMIISEAEAARQDRRIETLVATVQECSSWYDQSPREALTNATCNSIFAAGGLPNSTISGPSQSEVLLAELSKQNVETELGILVRSGMLMEDYMLKYGLEEPDEEYQCNE
ncbi:hypothetical protein OAE29_05715 [Octadecabacter sp.]|nr:hypothetical protein [Octadecabacter sp.]